MEKQESIEYIRQLLEKQEKLERLNQTTADTALALDKAQKALETYQIRIQEELDQVIKKQRSMIQNRLDREVQLAQRKVEQAEKQRAQEKNRQKKDHIADATEEYRGRIRLARSKVKSDIKKEKIPGICKRDIWFSLFMPTFLTDYVLLALTWLTVALGIPAIIYLLIPNRQIWHFYILFPLFVVSTILVYIKIYQATVGKHREILKECREQINEIHELKERIRKTEKNINRSDDESSYELKELDEKIEQARNLLNQAKTNQEAGMQEFEQKTRLEIADEFREKSKEKLEQLTGAMNELSKEKNLSMELAAELHLELIDDYEAKIGAENMTRPRLEQILQNLENGSADTLESALEIPASAQNVVH